MSRAFRQDVAAREAETLIHELGIDSLPVSPLQIAKEVGIDIRPLPAQEQPGVSGILVRCGNHFGILYSTSIDSVGYQNFSIGHEIGHFRLPGHFESVMQDGMHASYAGRMGTKDPFELEADHFSSRLLMPRWLFDEALRTAGEGLDAVVNLSAQCETSLIATAIRMTQRSRATFAIVVSQGRQVDYCFMSDPLREHDAIEWIRKGTLLPANSATLKLNGDTSKVESNERVGQDSNMQDWFGDTLEGEVYEEAIGLGPYGKTLTILTIDELPDAEELEADEELEESWTPRFRG
ncbi:MAG TPA: ImmA/IrrE family metallo-endopeptidase [Gammaproteobacteria bacterium]|nr:ImmA/IrrE family metallo-endopeptidase [Gammaproteobacteria bacterium]